MDKRLFKIQEDLLAHPGEWVLVIDVAHRTNLTKRQVASAVSRLPSPPFDSSREPGYSQFYIRFDGTEEDAAEYMKGFYKSRYGITDDMEDMVTDVLSTAGWMTVTDIASEVPLSRTEVMRVLRISGDRVVSEARGSTTYYKRKE